VVDEVPEPALAAALVALDLADRRVRPMWAAHWVADGLGGPRTAELAGLRGDEREVSDLWPESLAELGAAHAVVAPRRTAAAWCAQQVVSGRHDAAWLVRTLWPHQGWDEGDGDGEVDSVVYALDDLLDRIPVAADHPPCRRRARQRADEQARTWQLLVDVVVAAMAAGGITAAAAALDDDGVRGRSAQR